MAATGFMRVLSIIYYSSIFGRTLADMIDFKKFRRMQIRSEIESQCMGLMEEKIDRYLEIEHNEIIGNHYFAQASSECIYLYRDGYFIATVMMSHAINEGIIKFVAQRNNIERQENNGDEKSVEKLIDELKSAGNISQDCYNASKAIWKSYRNDVHHINPTVSKIPFKELAQSNIKHLSTIEKEIFNHHFNNGTLVPHQPKYWDTDSEGKTPIFLRLE
jgi:hypothetical protein